VKRFPEERQLRELIPVHEVRNSGRRLDLGVRNAGCFQLEEHRHAITAEAEEHALPQAENAAVSPANDKANRDERVSEILGDQVEPEDVQRQGQDDDQQYRQRNDADKFGAVREARIVVHSLGDNSWFGAFLGHLPGLFTFEP